MLRARQCLVEILELYQTAPGEKRPELLERVTDLYFLTLERQGQSDKDAFGDVLERMAYEANTISRVRLSERLAKSSSAPLELLRRLARDEICIARPVLQYSPCLREGDLVAISGEAEQEHLMATAHRAELTRPVTDIIVERGDVEVLKAVIGNTGAEISPESRAKLTNIPELHEALQKAHSAHSAHREIAPRPNKWLKRLTDGEFWQQITESALMTSEELDQAQPVNRAQQETENPDEQTVQQPKKKPVKAIALKPASVTAEKLLVDAAKEGNLEKTVKMFSRITLLDNAMIIHCLFEAHLPTLMVLCKAHHMTTSTFNTMLQLRERFHGARINDTVGLIRRYDGMTPNTAQRIIHFSQKRREAEEEIPQSAPA